MRSNIKRMKFPPVYTRTKKISDRKKRSSVKKNTLSHERTKESRDRSAESKRMLAYGRYLAKSNQTMKSIQRSQKIARIPQLFGKSLVRLDHRKKSVKMDDNYIQDFKNERFTPRDSDEAMVWKIHQLNRKTIRKKSP